MRLSRPPWAWVTLALFWRGGCALKVIQLGWLRCALDWGLPSVPVHALPVFSVSPLSSFLPSSVCLVVVHCPTCKCQRSSLLRQHRPEWSLPCRPSSLGQMGGNGPGNLSSVSKRSEGFSVGAAMRHRAWEEQGLRPRGTPTVTRAETEHNGRRGHCELRVAGINIL